MRKLAFCCAAAVALAAVATAGLRQPGRPVAIGPADKVLKPDRVAKVDIHGNILSAWKQLGGGATDGPTGCTTLCFDAYDMGSTLDADPVGGDLCGLPGPGYRWFFGTTYNIAGYINDMAGIPEDRWGKPAHRAVHGVYFLGDGTDLDPGTPELEQNFAVFIFTAEDWAADGCTFPAEIYDGIVAEFDAVPADPGGYYRVDIDVCGDPDLFWLKPIDGSGTYIMLWATYDAPGGPYFFTSTDAMLWGTCDAGGTPCAGGAHPRVGTQDFVTYLDDLTVPLDPVVPDDCPFNVNLPDGFFGDDDLSESDIECECVDFAFGICPDPLAPMFALLNESGDCCVGDADGDCDVDQSDLGLLLSNFNMSVPQGTGGDVFPAGGDGFVGQQDLGELLANYNCGV